MRFAYFYSMTGETERVAAAAAQHAAYWRGLGLGRHLGGPFGDRSGGLITFEAGSGEEAAELVSHDPFVRQGLLRSRCIKAWNVE